MNENTNKEKTYDKKFFKTNLLLIIAVIIIGLVPLLIVQNGEFAGADDQAKNVIAELHADYEPWFNNIWEPPSGEIASLLFCLQSALGAGFIGYFIGLAQGKKVSRNDLH